MSDSRIGGLYRLTVNERVDELERLEWLSAVDANTLRHGGHVLTAAVADKIIENVVGVFGLPFAIAPNFIVNGKHYLVPMAVEEPSIVAAASNAAKLAMASGGFRSGCDESLLAGQVYVTRVADMDGACRSIVATKQALIVQANEVHPRLLERGGGVRDVEVREVSGDILAVDFLVDTCDAMGANLVNTICESMAPAVAAACQGEVVLRILSNLVDHSIVTATVVYPLQQLDGPGLRPEDARDRVVIASEIAAADRYRAATHNKGIMNGIDAIAVATGNDWRAIEAGAHAYAAQDGHYVPLATWSTSPDGDLVGNIRMPLKVGTVGGTLAANKAAGLGLRVAGVESARELAELMAAVGLAQNFAALRALATAGIQHGHMRLHARSATLASIQGTAGDRAIGNGEAAFAAGKAILLGEHAVVYGKHALAVPIRNAVTATVAESESGLSVTVPEWGIDETLSGDSGQIGAPIALILHELGLQKTNYALQLHSFLPRGMGLGSSAAFAVAIIRAFDKALGLGLDAKRINAIAFAAEQLAHGTPSGVDNSLATYQVPMVFRNDGSLRVEELTLNAPPPIVIACSSQPGETIEQVAGVRARRDLYRQHYDAVFEEIDAISLAGAKALKIGDHAELGALMNICHGLLNAIGVSTAELEQMVSIARAAGAAGAKLTGAGGGGSIIALCPGCEDEVMAALASAGFVTLSLNDRMIE